MRDVQTAEFASNLILFGCILLSWRLLAIADDVKDTDRPGERERERFVTNRL